jgi:hypothetical protein
LKVGSKASCSPQINGRWSVVKRCAPGGAEILGFAGTIIDGRTLRSVRVDDPILDQGVVDWYGAIAAGGVRMISSSSVSVTIDESAAVEKINPSYVSRVLRLTLLAPEMVEAILDGRQPEGVTLPGLLEPFPVEWIKQTGCQLS